LENLEFEQLEHTLVEKEKELKRLTGKLRKILNEKFDVIF